MSISNSSGINDLNDKTNKKGISIFSLKFGMPIVFIMFILLSNNGINCDLPPLEGDIDNIDAGYAANFHEDDDGKWQS